MSQIKKLSALSLWIASFQDFFDSTKQRPYFLYVIELLDVYSGSYPKTCGLICITE
jgi:hypothetical protein